MGNDKMKARSLSKRVPYWFQMLSERGPAAYRDIEAQLADALQSEYERGKREAADWLEHATQFQFGGKAPNMACRVEDLPIRIEARDQRDGTRKWAVMQGGNCLRKDGEWEYEPLPSGRADEFLAMTRFDTKEEARAASEKGEKA